MELGLILLLVFVHLSAISALPVRSTASPGGVAPGRNEATPNDETPRSKVRRQRVEWNGRRRTAHLLDTLDEYDLSRPSIVDHRGQFIAHLPHPSQGSNPTRRHRRQAPPGEEKWIYFRLTAFGREFRLNLTQSRDFVSPSLTVEYWNGSGIVSQTQRKGQPDGRLCHFVGHVASDDRTSKAAVSNCHGLHGVFATPDDEYLVEPFWTEENGTSDSQFYHIVYRRSAIRIARTSSHCGVTDSDARVPSTTDRSPTSPHFWYQKKDKWRAVDVETVTEGRNGEAGMRRRKKRSAVSKRSYVETLVVADQEMVTYHGHDRLEHYLLTVMNIVARLFRDESIGNDINIVVSRIIILTAPQPGLQISYHADRSLESFCLWQQRISSMATATISNSVDQEIASHDNAVLLTRYDICTYKNLPCGTLGLAPVAGMCEPLRSCSINEDIGLATAFTVAHEIGHNFGMQHDGAGNDCGTPGHESARLMSSQLAKNREPFSWSSCSRNYITNFLDSGRGKCLENYPSQTKSFPNHLPGKIHDGDSQCRLLFGPSSIQCKRNEEVCRELWCVNPNNNQCVTNSIPAAEGTQCVLSNGSTTQGWCYRGKCVRTDWRPQPLDGHWGEWSSWGQCSRTCGGGVESSERKCDRPRPTDGGKFCIGERQRYRSCRTQDCAPDSTDFRELQCAKFNDQLFRNKFYTWKPFAGDHVRPCALNCLAVGFNFYTERSAKVIDGTRCHPDSLDICVNGECRHVGCDRILGSTAVEDKCRVCGGDGSTCETVRGRVDQAMEREASDTYFEIVRIPQGAVHIRFVETRISKNYLALKSPNGQYFINGAWTIDWPRSFEVAETVFRYERPKDRPETLTAVGPTAADLVLMTLIQETSLNVDYEYNVVTAASKGNSPTNTSSTSYTWQYLQWNDCSVTCGTGLSRSVAVCVMASDKTIVKHKFCLSSRPQPEDRIKYCSDQPCPAEWSSGEWTECSRTCGGGLRTRRVVCSRRVSAAGETEVIDGANCSGKKPKYKWRCSEEACPSHRWQPGDWSECRSPCGPGIRTRNVNCVDDDGSLVPTDHCDSSTRPSGQEECQTTACPLSKWTTGAWGECRSPCGPGIRTRNVYCVGDDGSFVPTDHCDSATRPSGQEECQTTACPLSKWTTGAWGECRSPCGPGIRTRNVYCVGDDGSLVPTDHCDSATRPSGQEECQMTACPLPKWTTGAWGECSCDGAGGFQMRTVACRTYNGEPSHSCDPRTMPSNRQECHGRCTVPPPEPKKPEDCTDINKVEYCPLVFKFRMCSRPYFRQLCCQTCYASGL